MGADGLTLVASAAFAFPNSAPSLMGCRRDK